MMLFSRDFQNMGSLVSQFLTIFQIYCHRLPVDETLKTDFPKSRDHDMMMLTVPVTVISGDGTPRGHLVTRNHFIF